MIGYSFKLLGKGAAESIITLTSNPFISLFIGLLITALIQSSSTSTSMIVAVVASGSIGLTEAVPMIMGANIGTTLTSTLVSLGFITKRNEFRKAISAGVVHDFFNIMTVIILFPLEYYYGVLSNLASSITGSITHSDLFESTFDITYSLFTSDLTRWLGDLIPQPIILILIAFVLLFFSIKLLSQFLYKAITGGSREVLKRYFFGGPYKSFLWGTAITAGVQSSSVTTSVIVPFVATGKISIKQAFTFILGANIGTTITALLAALFKSEAAISIALTHLLFNLIGVAIFLPFPFVRNIPVGLAKAFGKLTLNYRLSGFIYVLFTFFILPFLLISLTNHQEESTDLIYKREDSSHNTLYNRVKIKRNQSKNISHWFVYEGMKSPEEHMDTASDIFEVYEKRDMIVLDDLFVLFESEGACWDGNDSLGHYRICVEDILKNYRSESLNREFDSVYLYRKIYEEKPEDFEQLIIDPKDKLFLSLKRFNQDSFNTETMELISIKTPL